MKRIVLAHPDGLMTIIGLTETQPPETIVPAGTDQPLNLVAVKPRFYLYKLMLAPQRSAETYRSDKDTTFNPEQR